MSCQTRPFLRGNACQLAQMPARSIASRLPALEGGPPNVPAPLEPTQRSTRPSQSEPAYCECGWVGKQLCASFLQHQADFWKACFLVVKSDETQEATDGCRSRSKDPSDRWEYRWGLPAARRARSSRSPTLSSLQGHPGSTLSLQHRRVPERTTSKRCSLRYEETIIPVSEIRWWVL
jgi:hypothetical protein